MFLDVQMPGVDGFELLRAVPATLMPLTVFVTAYDQYALAAFAASALDYLLKPVDDARLRPVARRARARSSRTRAASDQCEQLLKLIATCRTRRSLSLDDAVDGDVATRRGQARDQGRPAHRACRHRRDPVDRRRRRLHVHPRRRRDARAARHDARPRAAPRSAAFPARAPLDDRQSRARARRCARTSTANISSCSIPGTS